MNLARPPVLKGDEAAPGIAIPEAPKSCSPPTLPTRERAGLERRWRRRGRRIGSVIEVTQIRLRVVAHIPQPDLEGRQWQKALAERDQHAEWVGAVTIGGFLPRSPIQGSHGLSGHHPDQRPRLSVAILRVPLSQLRISRSHDIVPRRAPADHHFRNFEVPGGCI